MSFFSKNKPLSLLIYLNFANVLHYQLSSYVILSVSSFLSVGVLWFMNEDMVTLVRTELNNMGYGVTQVGNMGYR